MKPIEWLSEKAPGFKELPEDDRLAIMHFSLLWSLFEATALARNASAKAIVTLVNRWAADSRLNVAPFNPSLAYFRNRYFKNGTPTRHFPGLELRDNDRRDLVVAVLSGQNTTPKDSVAALLIVVYRLRNNLFHGIKWADGIHGQLGNFTHANLVLMSALEVDTYL